MCYAVLEQAYDEDTADGEKRTVLRLSPGVAPVQVAVFPLMARDGLDTLSEEITTTLQKQGILAEYDDSGAIGRRYPPGARSAHRLRSPSITRPKKQTRLPSGTGTA